MKDAMVMSPNNVWWDDSAYSVGKFEPDYSHEGKLHYATGWVTVFQKKL